VRLEAGQLVSDRYRLARRIGSGGMADVWTADDVMLGRRVALKFLHERFAQDHQFVERFRREAHAAAGLQHQNVVGVYDRGDWEGRHWIAMEYVEGASLKDLIGRGLSVDEAVEIIRQVLAGARFAHGRGIVHRDLKPQNVLVDEDGRARVADFGIARAGASEITQTGSVLGTAQYLSPEQAQGRQVTAASDLYSIGVMLYEALTGRVPFEGDSAVAVALMQVSEQPRPPRELNPSVSPALDAVVLRALAKDPANRFSSADEFLHALDQAEAEPSEAAPGATPAYAAAGAAAGAAMTPEQAAAAERAASEGSPEQRRWMTRRRAIALAALALAALALAAFALTRTEQVTVPAVIDQPLVEARSLLERRGFDVDVSLVPNCANRNTVIEQDPPAGSDADEGSTVTLTTSLGLEVRVPVVRERRVGQARELIEDEDLLVRTRDRASPTVPSGRVVGSNPGAGELVDCGSVVTLRVSTGPDLVTLPSLVGRQLAEARAELRRLDLIAVVTSRDADQPEGEVIGQDPGPDSRLTRGEEVTITVSTGRGSAIVPNVEGQSLDAARQTLSGRGLNVNVVREETEERREDDRVLDQAPQAGIRVRAGDVVTIVVGRFVEPPTPPERQPLPPDPPTDETAP
jgi:eukaryotic-like serine/threonine-protein kinase